MLEVSLASLVKLTTGPESELQKKCREHAEKISMHTLFSPIARIEMVQAQSESEKEA
jgi:hypothetical protein